MNISKLLKMLLGLSGFLQFGIVEDGGGGGDDNGAQNSEPSLVDQFADYMTGDAGGDPADDQQQQAAETPEAAAERLAAEEAQAEENSQQEGQQTDENDTTLTIKVDGKDVQIKSSELPELYKNGLRQADYTRKTTEAAETRKTADAEITKAREEREHYAQNLNNFLLANSALQEQAKKVLTAEFAETDPMGYIVAKQRFDERQAEIQKAAGELQAINDQRTKDHEHARAAYQQEQFEKLQTKLPDWKDPAKAKAEAVQIKEYLSTQEFSDGDIGQLGDHRLILMARKAMQYDSLMKRAATAAKDIQKLPPKVERPTGAAPPTDGRSSAQRQFAKTGSRDDAAKAFAELFG